MQKKKEEVKVKQYYTCIKCLDTFRIKKLSGNIKCPSCNHIMHT
jgi:DNA-directed RNA polymerase subunit RPC12/RpoP